ncbi:MAG: glycosyltransferase family 39 protein, partial [Alloprevotella sp.]|nr:glycosyltransferase family 39 protein [Alloprevotella sp.]
MRTNWQTALRDGRWEWVRGLLVIAALSLLPVLGLSDFNTKGEPREAVVAQTMLASGNWVLPENNGGEFAYKPPMLHWAVAACSLPLGEVTEFTSRLPSALAAILAALATFRFFARRRDAQTGFLAALVFLTSSEVHRAAMNCRVDMLLTLFIVLALYAIARWVEGGLRGLPLAAILWMGCGTLTKGPVAILLPCLVGGAYAFVGPTD